MGTESTALSKMKVFAVIFALLALASGFKIATKRAQLITQARTWPECGPDETSCPTGCCPMGPNWYCCPDDNYYCAPTAADCVFEAKKAKLMEMAKSSQCGPDDTTCPNGCCPVPPELNWVCCDDFCAPTAADCPFVAKRVSLVKMAKSRQCGPDETSCPGGCCPVDPELNWFCCDDMCAATAADCPFEFKKTQLVKMTKRNQCGPDETFCYGGCCPGANWFFCDDVNFCAPTA